MIGEIQALNNLINTELLIIYADSAGKLLHRNEMFTIANVIAVNDISISLFNCTQSVEQVILF